MSRSHSDEEIERAAVLRLALPHAEFVKAALADPERAERGLKSFGMSEEMARDALFAPLDRQGKKLRRGPKGKLFEARNRRVRLRTYEALLKAMRVIDRLIPKGVTEATDLRQVVDPWISDEILEHVADYRRQRAEGQRGGPTFEQRAAMMVYRSWPKKVILLTRRNEQGEHQDNETLSVVDVDTDSIRTDPERAALRRLRNDQKAERKSTPNSRK